MKTALLAFLALGAGACRKPGPPPEIEAPAAALEAYATGDLPAAAKAADETVAKNPDDAAARNWRGRLKLESLDFAGAEQEFTRAIELDPMLAAAWYNRGNVRIDLGKLPQALEDLGQAARLDNELEGAPYSAGLAKQALGDYRGAADAFAIALKVNSGMRQARLRRAESLSSSGDRDEALLLLDKALVDDPDSVGALLQRGRLQENNHEPALAEADYSRVIELLPNEAIGYQSRARARRDALRLDAAEADYGEAIERKSDDADLLMARGRVRYHRRRYNEAIADWMKALRLDASHAREIKAYTTYIAAKIKAEAAESKAKTAASKPKKKGTR